MRESRSRPWASKSTRREAVAKPTPPPGGQLTTVGTRKDGKRLAPQTRLPVFNGDIKANTFVRHTLVDSFASGCGLPRLATKCYLAVEKQQKGVCAISKSSGAAGVVESSPPYIPVTTEVEAQRAVADSAADSNG